MPDKDEVKYGETVPGGRYRRGENIVDADGKILEGPDKKAADAAKKADAEAEAKNK